MDSFLYTAHISKMCGYSTHIQHMLEQQQAICIDESFRLSVVSSVVFACVSRARCIILVYCIGSSRARGNLQTLNRKRNARMIFVPIQN